MLISTLILTHALVSAQFVNDVKSYPNLTGGTGIMRTYSAVPNEPTTFGVQLITNFFTADPFIGGQKNSRNQLRVDGNYTPNWEKFNIEFFGGFSFSYNENSNINQSFTMTTYFENVDLGVRIPRALVEGRWYIGGYGHLRGWSGTRTARNTSGGSQRVTGPLIGGSAGVTSTLDLSNDFEKFPLRQHLTLGYRAPNGAINGASTNADFNRFSMDSYKYHAITAAVGAELVYKKWKPFIEASSEFALNPGSDSVSFSDNRNKATVGVKVTPMDAFAIIGAVDLKLSGVDQAQQTGIPRNPPWDAYLGLAFQTVGKKIANEEGSLRGIVTDSNTGMPLQGVSVTVVSETLVPQITDLSGFYEIRDLRNGNYQARFEKLGFEPVVRSFSIRDGSDTSLDVGLSVAGPKTGNLVGAIMDKETNQPISKAVIAVSSLDNSLAADERGQFKANNVVEGKQNVHIEAPGYLAQDFQVTITTKQTISENFALQKAPPEKGLCMGVVKNKDGTPLTAVFTSEEGVVSPFGTNPISGEFSQELPPGIHKFRVQAENYLPQEVECDVKAGDKSSINLTLEKPKEVTIVENKIILPDAIYFEFGSSVIKSESHSVLNQVAQVLTTRSDYKALKVEGHTDNIGSEAFNLTLSKKRAQAVRKYLMNKGIKGEKVIAEGYGKSKPIATNTTEEGRAENRRVEFNIVPKDE